MHDSQCGVFKIKNHDLSGHDMQITLITLTKR